MSGVSQIIRVPLSNWTSSRGVSTTVEPDGSLIFNEGQDGGFHLIGASNPDFAGPIRVRVLVSPMEGCDAEIYINKWDALDVCRISPSGEVLDQSRANKVTVERHEDGTLEVVADYDNTNQLVLLGTSQGPGGRYQAHGRNQLRFKSIEVTPLATDIALADWVSHGGTTTRLQADGTLVFNEGIHEGFHLIAVSRPAFATVVGLKMLVQPIQGCDAEVYVNHSGGVDICRIASSGEILDQSGALALSVRHQGDGTLAIAVEYHNLDDTILIGTSRGAGGRYAGRGRDQLRFKAIEIALRHDRIADEQRITLVDVGAQGGLQPEWAKLPRYVRPVLFEPNPVEATNLRAQLGGFSSPNVIEAALYSSAGPRLLYVTRGPGCTSLLPPNPAVVNRYRSAPIFDVMREVVVDCKRYDQLHQAGEAPQPDAIKIDVQGAEYEVLQGFGRLLESCLGIELETHLYQLYRGQKLLGDIVAFLDGYDFSIRDLRRVYTTDGDAVEFNAFFTKRRDKLPGPQELAASKLTLIERVWGLKVHDASLALVNFVMPRGVLP